MTIKDLFEEVKRRQNNGSHSLSSIYGDTELYARFRASYGVVLKKEDEDFLIAIAEDEEWAGFVPNVVNVLEEFSENVLKAIIKSVVVRYSRILECAFVPCIRVFGILKVDEVLINHLKNGTNNERRGVLGAFYFARPTITGRSSSLSKGNIISIRRTFGYKFYWDELKECYIGVGNQGQSNEKIQMTANEFINYCPIVRQFFSNRQKALFEAFKYNENRYMQLLFVSHIERASKRFHPGLKMDTAEYSMLKKQRGIPESREEFEEQMKIERGKEYYKTLFN